MIQSVMAKLLRGENFTHVNKKKTVKHGGGNIIVWSCFCFWNGVDRIHR